MNAPMVHRQPVPVANYKIMIIKLIKIVKISGGRMLIAPGAARQERVTTCIVRPKIVFKIMPEV